GARNRTEKPWVEVQNVGKFLQSQRRNLKIRCSTSRLIGGVVVTDRKVSINNFK
ncbi:hypothetical protein HAX54_014166, partial [Datura stramonium]|nr:hypothetical protein [Datura stramonium]